MAVPAVAAATTFTVTTTADSNDGSCTALLCSFRDALNAADASAGSTVIVPAGTYKATMLGSNGAWSPTGMYTIQGAGAGQTIIDGNQQARTFAFYGQITVIGVTVTGGHNQAAGCECGAGFEVRQGGFLTLIDSVVTGNVALADGGGIDVDSQSRAILQNVVVSQNSAPGDGGGIHVAPTSGNTGTLQMTNVTISGNATGSGKGGGLDNQGTTTGTNATFAGNIGAGGGGAIANESTGLLSLTNATISTNITPGLGAGIYNLGATGNVTVRNTIVADGCAGAAAPAVASQGHNLDTGATCGFAALGDLNNRDPMLGPLANNGGSTGLQTMALLTGSPAIDAGDNAACPITDARGVSRPQGPLCDIGAVEYAPPVLTLRSATGTGASGTTLNGTVNPNLRDAVYHFEFGRTTAYGSSTPATDAGSGGSAVPATAVLTGLSPRVTYHYRLVATNGDGTSSTGDATFTTAPPSPTLTNVSQSARRWKRGKSLPRISSATKIPTGTTFKFTLNETARVTLAFTQPVPGRRVGNGCVKETKHNKHRPKCPFPAPRGSLSFTGHAGVNTVVFQGRINKHHRLAPGTYTLTITAVNSAHQSATPGRLVFTIVM
jgi:CSLREA domain-containing protein